MQVKGYSLTVKYTFTALLIAFSMMLCGCMGEFDVEEGIMERMAFVEITVDVQLLESAYKNKVFINDNEEEVLEQAYLSIFKKHGVSQEEFEASHTWWWSRPEEVKNVLIQVTEKLNILEAEMSPRATQSSESK